MRVFVIPSNKSIHTKALRIAGGSVRSPTSALHCCILVRLSSIGLLIIRLLAAFHITQMIAGFTG